MTTGKPIWSEDDFKLASWLVLSKVAKSHMDVYFAAVLGGTNRRSFRAALAIQQHLEVVGPFCEYLVSMEADIDNGGPVATFYYRNIIDCVSYLIH